MERIKKRRQTVLIVCMVIFLGFGIGSSSLRLVANGIAKWGSNPLTVAAWAPHDWQLMWAVSLNQLRNRPCFETIVSLKQVLRTHPNFWGAKNNLAICYASMGKFDDAKKHWEEILREWPWHEAAKKNLQEIQKKSRPG